jgi:hypothetical protein
MLSGRGGVMNLDLVARLFHRSTPSQNPITFEVIGRPFENFGV